MPRTGVIYISDATFAWADAAAAGRVPKAALYIQDAQPLGWQLRQRTYLNEEHPSDPVVALFSDKDLAMRLVLLYNRLLDPGEWT
jgi:hypothetical protein